ncbi:putative reverse transcriptase domain-containing protein [Tanacetum coccineum]
MEGIIDDDDESHNNGWKRWDRYENAIHDHEERENEEEHGNEERWELFDNPHQEAPVCKIRRFEMIKYSFGKDEENVTIKEHEYNDLTSTNEDACRTYQEIFRRMDEGWMGRGKNGNPAHGRAFVMGAEEALQDPNIVTGTFSLNNHYAMMLFDSGADYSFVSTTFMPLLDIKPSSPGFNYEIEIVSGQLVEINKVTRGFRIPLPHAKMLRVYGERLEEKVKCLMSAKAEGLKLEDIAIIQNFSKVFLDDLLGLPPSREVEFCIDLIPGAMSVAKSPNCLARTEMEELSNQLKEL